MDYKTFGFKIDDSGLSNKIFGLEDCDSELCDGFYGTPWEAAPPIPTSEVVIIDGVPMMGIPNDKMVIHYEVEETGRKWDAVFQNGRCVTENEYDPLLNNAPD